MPLVFLHGLGQRPDSWSAVAQAFQEQALSPDLFALLRGGEVSYQKLCKAFSEYCKGLDGPLRLCGLSLGGILALQYAIDRPEHVESLVLIGTQYVMPKTLLKFQNLMFRLTPEKAFRQMGLRRQDIISLTISMLDIDLREDLRRVSCPVLLLCGERDRANRKAALGLQSELPKAELAWVSGAGHEINADAPQELCKMIKDFYSRYP